MTYAYPTHAVLAIQARKKRVKRAPPRPKLEAMKTKEKRCGIHHAPEHGCLLGDPSSESREPSREEEEREEEEEEEEGSASDREWQGSSDEEQEDVEDYRRGKH